MPKPIPRAVMDSVIASKVKLDSNFAKAASSLPNVGARVFLNSSPIAKASLAPLTFRN